ncbi:hypothetical protein ACN28I_24670 [Archangium gephyra]|uniref:hypothetical protein n=1 Tax=Archangium gephyra TaxID=48 RepID=UPI003B76A00F
MSFTIHIEQPVAPLLEELPFPVRDSLRAHLQRIAETAEFLPPEDPRWEDLVQVQPDGDGLRTYVAGCCVRLHLLHDSRELVVEQIGRVRIRLPESLALAW